MVGYLANIEKLTLENDFFRKVLFTGQHLQLVLMSLKPHEEIGLEIHTVTDQFLRIESGEGKVVLNKTEHVIKDDDVIIVPAGVEHNIINTSATKPLKLYSLYAPPHHKDGIIHKTKAEAEHDHDDHL